MEAFTTTQTRRLAELNAPPELLGQAFGDVSARDAAFKAAEHALSLENRAHLLALVDGARRPLVCRIEASLVRWLTKDEGFTQVVTPMIISEAALSKMAVTPEHPLSEQVFWLDGKKCLRPMLAPNLYVVMRDMRKALKRPVKLFECGPCFRKETQGARHMNEFTMLNLVELATVNEGEQMPRLRALAKAAMAAIGISDYTLETAGSAVYGETLDIIVNGVEVASGAYGPHPLDGNWGVFDPWVGIGFGIERLAMVLGGYQSVKRVGRSVAHVDGVRLNL